MILHHLVIYVISKKKGEILHQTPLQELFNLRWYTQHLVDKSGDEIDKPRSEQNWILQTNWKSIKYVTCNKHSIILNN